LQPTYDESGGEDLRFTFVCGYAASIAQWESFEVDWKLFLIKFGVPYLHMKEFSQSKKCYAGWKGNESLRARFLGMASEIIAAHLKRAIMCIVSHECFENVNLKYRVCETFSSPYALASRTCIALANNWARRSNNGVLAIKHVFEDGGPDKGGLIQAVRAFPPFLPSPAFESSRDVQPSKYWPDGRVGLVQIQAADYLAYEGAKLVRDLSLIKSGERQIRKSLKALARVELDKSSFDANRLEQMFEGAEGLSPGRFKRNTE
jgi:hypothetical protein